MTTVAPASCRLSRWRLALGAAGEDARRTAAGTAALLSVVKRHKSRGTRQALRTGSDRHRTSVFKAASSRVDSVYPLGEHKTRIVAASVGSSRISGPERVTYDNRTSQLRDRCSGVVAGGDAVALCQGATGAVFDRQLAFLLQLGSMADCLPDFQLADELWTRRMAEEANYSGAALDRHSAQPRTAQRLQVFAVTRCG